MCQFPDTLNYRIGFDLNVRKILKQKYVIITCYTKKDSEKQEILSWEPKCINLEQTMAQELVESLAYSTKILHNNNYDSYNPSRIEQ